MAGTFALAHQNVEAGIDIEAVLMALLPSVSPAERGAIQDDMAGSNDNDGQLLQHGGQAKTK